MTSYTMARRGFLRSVGASVGLRALLRNAESRAAGPTDPIKRFLVIHHPIGTVRPNWICTGADANFTLSRILKPFEPVRPYMAALDGLDLPQGGAGGGHERGTVVMMTGVNTKRTYPGNGGDDPYAEGPSVDQLFLKAGRALQGPPIASLQLSCDERVDEREVSCRRLSYTPDPMTPYLQPVLAYERVFGTQLPGALTESNMEAFRKARAAQGSVLDLSLRDLARLRKLAPASEKERLDAHEAAIRALEKEFDKGGVNSTACGLAEKPPQTRSFVDLGNWEVNSKAGTPDGDDVVHENIGRLHLAVVRAAFSCDLTRVVTFQWSPGTNHVSFKGLWPDDPKAVRMHHPVSHMKGTPEVLEFLTRVDEWYSTRVSAFLQTLAATRDVLGGGNLLDNTLVPYVTEVAEMEHSHKNMPIVLFGGKGVRLNGGVYKTYGPGRRMNDMWLACAQMLGVPMPNGLGGPGLFNRPLKGLVL